MSSDSIFVVIVLIFLFETLLTKVLGYLNTTRWSEKLPTELEGIYDAEKYSKSQKYEKTKYRFGWISSLVSFSLMFAMLLLG